MAYCSNLHGDNVRRGEYSTRSSEGSGGGAGDGTYFSGRSGGIFGNQWLPWSPGLSYLSEDRDVRKKKVHTMHGPSGSGGKRNGNRVGGSGLGNVMMTFAAKFRSEWTAEQMTPFGTRTTQSRRT